MKRKKSESDLNFKYLFHYATFGLILFLILFGAILNLLVLATNNGKMPVQVEPIYTVNSPRHFGFQDPNEVNNYYLTDIIDLGNCIYSFGDLVMILGIVLLIINSIIILRLAILKKRYKKSDKNKR